MGPFPNLVSVEDARQAARRRWPRLVFEFIDGAAGEEHGTRMARKALLDLRLQSRVLVDISAGDLTTSILGKEYALPFGIAPMGMCNLSWSGADGFLAELARSRNLPLCVSTAASTTIEDIVAVSGNNTWFQLYPDADSSVTETLAQRAADSGCEVLIFTVDVPRLGRRPRELRSGFKVPFKIGAAQFWDFATHPDWSLSTLMSGVPTTANFGRTDAVQFQRGDGRGKATWELLERLRTRWSGKLVVKGVLSVADAQRIRESGADAVYASSHGGRQLDGAIPPIYALAAIRDALGADYPLIYDTGIRCGEDIVKAMVAGADFVMLGRPFLYAIGAGKFRALETITQSLVDDIRSTLAQIGVSSVARLSRDSLSWWQSPGCPDCLAGRPEQRELFRRQYERQ